MGSPLTRMDWAKLGAETRLREIDQERAAILAAFPDLDGPRPSTRPRAKSRPRRKFSAAARRRMAAGMRKYWAKRRAAQKERRATS